ncbi:DcrB-related protein [Salmonella enterica]
MNKPFVLSEGVLNLPGAYQDTSINVLKFKEAGATLVVTRAWAVNPGEEESYLNQQLEKVKRNMKKVVIGDVQDSNLAGQTAREVSLRFQNQHVTVYEKLAVTRFEQELLVFTLSRLEPFNDEAEAFWAAIKSGVQLGA